ncbi:MAG: hypothetical protein IJS08_16925 [Victivallales bacterium]|nr:hypothetical protein [Victivallales bacterium]
MRNVSISWLDAKEWQRKILNKPAKIEALIKECYLNPSRCHILQEFYTYGLWGELLLKHPQLKDYCNEDLQREKDFPDYLYSHPEEINEKTLSVLNGSWLEEFIMRCPEHILECPVEKLTSKQVLRLMIEHPEFAEKLDFAECLDENEWEELLNARPDFFELCPADRIPLQMLLYKINVNREVWNSIDKDKLSSYTWRGILEKHQEYVYDCNLAQLEDYDYGYLISLHPEWYSQECHGKLENLSCYFWVDSGLYLNPMFRKDCSSQNFGVQEWRLLFRHLGEDGILPVMDYTRLDSLAELARLAFLDVGNAGKPYKYTKNDLRGMVFEIESSPYQFNRVIDGCLKYKDFKRLEYLVQLDRELVLSKMTSFRKVLALCVYAPYSIVCQLLPGIDPQYVCEVDECGNTALHYTFLRDPFGDDPETCSIRKLLLKMGVKDTKNDNGFTLADLHGFMLKATEQAK